MGNTQGASEFQGGSLVVDTNHDYYAPGNEVYGKIYIRATEVLQADKISLRALGKEESSFWRGGGKNRHKVYYKKVIFDFLGDCFTFQGPLAPGDYCVGFQFTLPPELPSSILFLGKHHDKPFAKITYVLTANLHMRDRPDTISKDHYISVQEPPVEFKQDELVSSQMQTGCCCCKHGTAGVEARFDKNIFYTSEKTTAKIKIDNSRCNLPIKKVHFGILQKIFLHGVAKKNKCCQEVGTFRLYPLKQYKEVTIPRFSRSVEELELTLDFSSIHFTVAPTKKVRKGFLGSEEVDRTPAEIFQLSHLPAPCHSTHVSNDYFLHVYVEHDQCCACCATPPHAQLPMTLIPLSYKDEVQQPVGFNPLELGFFKFELSLSDPAADQSMGMAEPLLPQMGLKQSLNTVDQETEGSQLGHSAYGQPEPIGSTVGYSGPSSDPAIIEGVYAGPPKPKDHDV